MNPIDYPCTICTESMENQDHIVTLHPEVAGGHKFHQLCIDPWLGVNPSCPICRHPVHFEALPAAPQAVVQGVHAAAAVIMPAWPAFDAVVSANLEALNAAIAHGASLEDKSRALKHAARLGRLDMLQALLGGELPQESLFEALNEASSFRKAACFLPLLERTPLTEFKRSQALISSFDVHGDGYEDGASDAQAIIIAALYAHGPILNLSRQEAFRLACEQGALNLVLLMYQSGGISPDTMLDAFEVAMSFHKENLIPFFISHSDIPLERACEFAYLAIQGFSPATCELFFNAYAFSHEQRAELLRASCIYGDPEMFAFILTKGPFSAEGIHQAVEMAEMNGHLGLVQTLNALI